MEKPFFVLDLSFCGLVHGFLRFLGCFSGGSLRDVNVSCTDVTDEDIMILAVTCLAAECDNLAVLNISGCFEITDEGVLGLCPHNGVYVGNEDGNREPLNAKSRLPENRRGSPALRSLVLANLTNLTDDAILAVGGLMHDLEYGTMRSEDGGLKKLLLLDVRGCANVSSWALGTMMAGCPSIIELEARGTYGRVLRNSLPGGSLRFRNGSRLPPR
jgi:hypothetical protein